MFIILAVFSNLRAYLSMSYPLEPVRPNWTPPVKRYCSCVNYFNGYLIVFGGRNFEKKFNDFWTTNIWYKTWERLSLTGEIMSNLYLGPRSDSLMFFSSIENQEMYIFGGKDEYGYITEVWYYNNLLGYTEKVLDFKEIRGLTDYSSGTLKVNSQEIIFVYGGRTLSKFSTDLWM